MSVLTDDELDRAMDKLYTAVEELIANQGGRKPSVDEVPPQVVAQATALGMSIQGLIDLVVLMGCL